VILTLLCGKGSPGATATAVAMALRWPRPVLLVDADPSGASIGYGYGQGADAGGRGLLGAQLAARRGDPVAAVWANVVVLGPYRWLLPGVDEPRQAATIDYPALADNLGRLGVDVIIDAGRAPGPCRIDGLLAGSDRVVVVLRPTLPGVHTAQTTAAAAASTIDGAPGVGSVILGPGRPYPEADVRAAMRDIAPVAGIVAWDPAAAAVITDGTPAPRRWAASPLLRSVTRLATALAGLEPEPLTRAAGSGEPDLATQMTAPAAAATDGAAAVALGGADWAYVLAGPAAGQGGIR
jgi:MinD-like ATPase involved in chromosome partitioning or flagellar assembly